jgi:hypothetical protein
MKETSFLLFLGLGEGEKKLFYRVQCVYDENLMSTSSLLLVFIVGFLLTNCARSAGNNV